MADNLKITWVEWPLVAQHVYIVLWNLVTGSKVTGREKWQMWQPDTQIWYMRLMFSQQWMIMTFWNVMPCAVVEEPIYWSMWSHIPENRNHNMNMMSMPNLTSVLMKSPVSSLAVTKASACMSFCEYRAHNSCVGYGIHYTFTSDMKLV